MLSRNADVRGAGRAWKARVVAGLLAWGLVATTVDAQMILTYGANDGSGSEFSPASSSIFDTRTMTVAQFPRRLNVQTQLNVVMNLDAFTATNGLLVVLDAFEDGGSGTVMVEGRVRRGGMTSSVYGATTWASSTNHGVLYMPPSVLASGVNTVELKAVTSIGSSTYLKWDQVVIESVETQKFANIELGADDGLYSEFATNNFIQAFNAVTMTVAQFPRKLDDTSWSKQEIWFYIDPATAQKGKPLSLILDAAWMENSPFQCLVDFVSNRGVYEPRSTSEKQIVRDVVNTVTIPAEWVVPGDAMIQLHHKADDLNRLFWDRISIVQNMDIRLGADNNSELEFLANPIEPDSHYFNADAMPVSMLPKELNTTWWRGQEISVVVSKSFVPRLVLDAKWESPWNQPMPIVVDTVSAYGTVACGTYNVSHLSQVTIPLNRAVPPAASGITSWPMTIRLRAFDSTNVNKIVVWDSMRIYGP